MKKLSRYTVFVEWPGRNMEEEIDVDAESARDARMKALKALKDDYEPGGKIIEVLGPRFGLYM